MAKINIKGAIVSNDVKWIYEWFEMEAVCPKDIENALNEAGGEDVEIEINSGGGSVTAGSEIYTSLKGYKGKTVGKIVGIAASAAGVAGMGVDILEISPTAQIMIHNVSSAARGDYRALDHESNVIKNYNISIANSYILKTGMSENEILKMMNEETWLNAQQAKEKGFVDTVMFDQNNQLVASTITNSSLLPQEIIEKMINEKKNIVPKNEKNDNINLEEIKIKQSELSQARLNLLKMGVR